MNKDFNETWTIWEPFAVEEKAEYSLDYLIDSPSLFKLIVASTLNNPSRIEICFEHSVYAYRRTYETFRAQLISDISKKYGEDFDGPEQFFMVTNSDYIAWLSEQSGTISNEFDLQHYCFMDDDCVVDIVDTAQPTIVLK